MSGGICYRKLIDNRESEARECDDDSSNQDLRFQFRRDKNNAPMIDFSSEFNRTAS